MIEAQTINLKLSVDQPPAPPTDAEATYLAVMLTSRVRALWDLSLAGVDRLWIVPFGRPLGFAASFGFPLT